ncbi:MAG: WG repeat-containing protein [bacterium]|nr:WG repeat-containing protein [bacterium]
MRLLLIHRSSLSAALFFLAIIAVACAPGNSEVDGEDASADFTAAALEAFEDEASGLWGYRNPEGAVVIEPAYQIAGDFRGALAGVVDDSGWAMIDARGAVFVRPFVFDNGPDPYRQALARFVDERGRMGFFNSAGEIEIPAAYDFAEPFEKSGTAAVCMKCELKAEGEHRVVVGGEWGRIDRSGKLTAPIGSVTRE